MKSLILALVLVSGSALADRAKMNMPAFSGELKVYDDVKVTSVMIEAILQHCSVGTCAGGPRELERREIIFSRDSSTNLIKVSSPKEISLSSFKPLNKFSSCKAYLYVLAENAQGVKYAGQVSLIHVNDKEVCESSSKLKEIVSEKFKVPVEVQMWRY